MTHRALVLAFALLPAAGGGCQEKIAADPPDIIIEDQVEGKGEPVKDGDHVGYWYTVHLFGQSDPIDSNVGKQLYKVHIGEHKVIHGMEQGLIGMKVGGRRRMVIPSRLAYGEKGKPPRVPPNAPLDFDVELVSIGQR